MATTWTSGAFSTSNDDIKYKIYIIQNSQSTSGNSSNVTVKVRFYRTNSGHTTYGSGTVTCVIDGTTYTASVDSSDKITSSGIYLFNKTLTIKHNSDGTKTLSVSAKIKHSKFSASSHSYSHALTTIPRKSTLSVGNGTLGTSQTLTVSRESSSFTHTITYACGSASGTVCSKSSSTSISFTPPLSLASQNITGTTVTIKYTITTYNGSTSIGSNSYTKTCSIPSSVKPSCTIAVSDPNGYSSTYGGYVKGMSKIKVVITSKTSYGSEIASYNTTVSGCGTYTSSSFTTGVVPMSGSITIKTTVTDKRGRTGTATTTITGIDYSPPYISKLSVNRCDSDGTSNTVGEYVKITFSATVASIGSKNTSTYTLKYKKTSASSYTSVTLSSYKNNYSVTDGSYIFSADSASSYNVEMNVTDAFQTVKKKTSASTGLALIHWLKDGFGMAVGKISEISNVFDIGFQTKFTGGLYISVLADGTNFNDLKTSNIFYCYSNRTYSNAPESGNDMVLEIYGISGSLIQRVSRNSRTEPIIYERCYYGSEWGEWIIVGGSTEWVDATITSSFDYYSNSSVCRYKRNGSTVYVEGVVKPSATITGGTSKTTIFTLKEGFRPSRQKFFVCQGAGKNTWLCTVNTSGIVDFSRYGGTEYANATTSTWLPFNFSFALD